MHEEEHHLGALWLLINLTVGRKILEDSKSRGSQIHLHGLHGNIHLCEYFCLTVFYRLK